VSQTVFVLGAGASAQAGAPLMNTFIRVAQDIMRGGTLSPNEQENFDLVFKARMLLQQAHSKSELNIRNIESLFGAFDMAALMGRLGNLDHDEVSRLPNAVRYVIAKTIESCVKYEVNRGGLTLSPKPYDGFVEIVRGLHQRGAGSVSIITFNYDVGLDYALHANSMPFEYRCGVPAGVDFGKKLNLAAIDLLKLHGSLNWGRCEKCQRICPWELKDFFAANQWSPLPKFETTRTLEIANRLSQRTCPVCGTSLSENPVIVPPTWNKGNAHVELSSVWRAAAEHLAEAENVCIIGYSLPITDEFFRYFYALSTVGETVLDTFLLVDPDTQASERFRTILGPTARDCFRSIPKQFEAALPEIKAHLRLM
jgi:NAD-dependent SIR2 family protein deacetylase